MEHPTHQDPGMNSFASRATAMAPIVAGLPATRWAQKRGAPALALSVEQACEALGVSWDTWRAHIEPDVRLVRLGRRKLIPVSELQAWLDRHAESVGVGE
ncbi:MAG TPA: helix-turn-helix domain-containing protein [Solirubrobacteraceae bacterium]|nr:helix-turn-helix domain-containing protein [Solirubrobacteraceae bacterium]